MESLVSSSEGSRDGVKSSEVSDDIATEKNTAEKKRVGRPPKKQTS